MNQRVSRLMLASSILLFLAMAMSGYMTAHHYKIVSGDMGFDASFCSINAVVDCDDVLGSKYSEILGTPLTVFSAAYYLFAVILSLLAGYKVYSRREALLLLLGLSGVSVGVSVATFILSFFVLQKICLLCSTLQVANVISFGLTLAAYFSFASGSSLGRELKESSYKRLLSFIVAGLAIFIVTYGLMTQLKIDHYPLVDEEKYVNDFRASKPVQIEVGDSVRQGYQGPNPPLQLIEFADFECPGCGWAARFMHRLLPAYKDKVQLVFKNFPLNMNCNPAVQIELHKNACLAARAAVCARRQGKFPEMYDKLFGHQMELTRDNINVWAKEIGLDAKAFDDCIPAPETLAAIVADAEQGRKAGLESTPTFFANGRMVKGAIDEARLKLLLRELGL